MFSVTVFMLNWIREKFLKRQSSRLSSSSTERSDTNCNIYPNIEYTMHTESISNSQDNKITLYIIYEGEIWDINVDRHQIISDLINMAISHFLDPKEIHSLASKFRLISVSKKRIINPQQTVGDAQLNNDDEVLLSAPISTGATNPVKLTLKDIKGPSKEEIVIATANLTSQNAIQAVPAFDCQENFQSEIRKVLYSLVGASAKILAQSPDAKVIFDGIAARINAKNKKEVDKNAVKYLKDLGFTEVQARYALRLKRNRQIEAMEWLLENSHRVKEDNVDAASTSTVISPVTPVEDPLFTINKLLQDIRDFHQRHFEPSVKALETLQAMGFNQDDAVEALKVTGNNQVAACEWLCGERDPGVTQQSPGLDTDGPLYRALMNNPAIQLGLHNPKIMLAFLSILENPSSANLWLNDVDTAPVLGQVFKTYHSEKHIMVVNQQVELMRRQHKTL